MRDKRVLITGATDGLGKHVARDFAAEGAVILFHGRNREKGQSVLEEIRNETGNENLTYYNADFASLDEIRQMTGKIKEENERLDLLINNAGIGFGKPGSGREESRDGYELRFQVNYLSGFMLTVGLLPMLKQASPARIVNVASGAQQSLDFDNLMLEEGWSGQRAYAQSKLAQIMFTFELTERVNSSELTVNALHPATFMDTNMVREADINPTNEVKPGADAVEYLAASPDLKNVTGKYFNGKREASANEQAYDTDARQRLWQLSEELTGVQAELVAIK